MTEAGRLLVLGYGNPGRGDDGAGPAVAARIEALGRADVAVETPMQLNIEDAATAAESRAVLFIDAAVEGPAPYEFRRARPAGKITFTSHALGPEALLAVCAEYFNARPPAWVLAVRGHEFALGEALSPACRGHVNAAAAFAADWVGAWREHAMKEQRKRGKTVCIIDDDPDVLEALRVAFEAAGFSVAEARSAESGLRNAESLWPDAVVVDLMMETVDAGADLAGRLRALGYDRPIYLLSSAADGMAATLDPADAGLTGVLQKPYDPTRLAELLKARLGAA